ncbi:hypothetical protein E4633_07275, partial [Geomonas terrae]
VYLNQASPYISRSVIRNSLASGVFSSNAAKAVVRDSELYGNGGCGITGFSFGSAVMNVSGNVIRNNQCGISLGNGVVNNNIIAGNSIGVTASSSPGTVSFSYNSIVNSAATAVSMENQSGISYLLSNTFSGNSGDQYNNSTIVSGNGFWESNTVISSNNLFDLVPYAIYNRNVNSTPALSAINNWWGTAVDGAIQAKIYDWLDDGSKGVVNYVPYLTIPNVAAPISPPSEVKASLNGTDVTLSWKANPEGDVAGFKIYWGTEAGYSYANSADVGSGTSYTLTGIDPTKIYHVAVTAYDNDYDITKDDPDTAVNENQTNGNESWYSEVVVTATPPNDTEAPVNRSINFIDGGIPATLSVNVSLALVGTDNTGIVGYWISESSAIPKADDSGWTTVATVKAYAANIPFVLSGAAGTKTVYVWFKDAAGNLSEGGSSSIVLHTSLTGTPVYGVLTSNTTWTKSNSPYVVLNNILVPVGTTLTVEPGVVVKFDKDRVLQINGTLLARGTFAQPIIFTSGQTSPAAGDWGRIYFDATSTAAVFDSAGNYLNGSIIEHSIVEYGAGPDGMVYLNQASPYISRSVIRNSLASGVFSSNAAKAVVRDSELYGNGGCGITGFSFGSAVMNVSGNVIRNNQCGISLGNGVVNNNIIAGNSIGVTASSSPGTVSFSYNSIVNSAATAVSMENQSGISYLLSNTFSGNSGDQYNNSTIVSGNGFWESNTVISSNNLFDLVPYAIYNRNVNSTPALSAINNWWGTAVDGAIQAKIYDWLDDGSKGVVNYVPYLTIPNVAAPISPPSEVKASLNGTDVTLSWKANPEGDVAGFKIYWGTEAGYSYANSADVGSGTSYTLTGIDPTKIYHVAVTAYDNDYDITKDDPDTAVNENQTNGNESWYSEVIIGQVVNKVGDCNNDGQISIAEVFNVINRFLGVETGVDCVDVGTTNVVTITDIQKAFNNFLANDSLIH